jgi:Asp-tRNA(Asn)/Glu-tRNA(Gln) amidotransferase A subunit family amidase
VRSAETFSATATLIMAKSIRSREISSVELVTAHLERIEQMNPAITAVVELLANSAVRQAKSYRQLAAGDGNRTTSVACRSRLSGRDGLLEASWVSPPKR